MSYDKLFDLSGKHALVIGAGSGIGAATAEGLAAFGASVLCGDLDVKAALNMQKLIGDSAEAVHIDITDQANVDEVVGAMAKIDVLVLHTIGERA